jgi:glycerol-3-phosphate dehydrogenase
VSVVDVLVIGAGVVGAAIARELGRYDGSVALVDAAADVASATSKANTAILHTGFDAYPGTLESAMVSKGYHLLADYASQAGIAVEPLGALLVAWDEEQLAALDGIEDTARRNGYARTRRVGIEELYAREPHLGTGALGAVEVPDESIIDPWSVPLALATEAVRLGVALHLRHEVVGVIVGDEATEIEFADGSRISARWVVNAAGLGSDLIDHAFGHERFTIVPRRGQLLVFDKQARHLVHHIVLPVPSSMGKGVLVAPTVFGNVMLGPTAENLEDRTATASTRHGIDGLLDKGRRLVPALVDEEVTAIYAGLRAATEHDDYQVHADADQRYVCVAGIRSTGLTSSLALAAHVRELLVDAGLPLHEARDAQVPRMPNLGEAFPRPYQRDELIATDPAYGTIVCYCERVTAGELRDAVSGDVPACTWDGLRRRTRAMNGRCQGFFCAAGIESSVVLAEPAPRADES